MAWHQVMQILFKYIQLEKQGDTGQYHAARIKQWLGYLCKKYVEAVELFNQIHILKISTEVADVIEHYTLC